MTMQDFAPSASFVAEVRSPVRVPGSGGNRPTIKWATSEVDARE